MPWTRGSPPILNPDDSLAAQEDRWLGQNGFALRLEWGRRGADRAAARGDVLVIVDVLSFSTAVAVAVHAGAVVFPCARGEDTAERADALNAEIAVSRGDAPEQGRFSLSPGTFDQAEPGTRVLLASPNGATCTRVERRVPALYVGGLVNARAVALAAARAASATGAAITVLACGERWLTPGNDGESGEELRFAIEDHIGAGAILHFLPPQLTRSPEAYAAQAVFEAAQQKGMLETLLTCGSGVELADRGYENDVVRAARLNAYETVPVLRDGERLEAEHL